MSVEREMSLAEWCAKLPSLHLVNQELSTLNTQLAALAEQNKKLKDALENHSGNCKLTRAECAAINAILSFPDLATFILNKEEGE